jgi:hypothetical protein
MKKTITEVLCSGQGSGTLYGSDTGTLSGFKADVRPHLFSPHFQWADETYFMKRQQPRVPKSRLPQTYPTTCRLMLDVELLTKRLGFIFSLEYLYALLY